MFQAFFDESGVHADSAMFTLAGYVAPQKEWERFIPKWQAVLNKYGINLFHASHCNGNKGEFAKFEGDRNRRNKFVAELLSLIGNRPRIMGFSSGVAVKEFSREMLVRISPTTHGHPYYVTMKSLMSMIALTLKQRGSLKSEAVALVFDRHAELSGYAVDLFNRTIEDKTWADRDRFTTIAFASTDEAIPLQAADAFAYDSCREMQRIYYHPERKPRPSYEVLARHLAFSHVWNQAEIAQFKNMTFEVMSRRLGTTDPERIWNGVKLPKSGLFS